MNNICYKHLWFWWGWKKTKQKKDQSRERERERESEEKSKGLRGEEKKNKKSNQTFGIIIIIISLSLLKWDTVIPASATRGKSSSSPSKSIPLKTRSSSLIIHTLAFISKALVSRFTNNRAGMGIQNFKYHPRPASVVVSCALSPFPLRLLLLLLLLLFLAAAASPMRGIRVVWPRPAATFGWVQVLSHLPSIVISSGSITRGRVFRIWDEEKEGLSQAFFWGTVHRIPYSMLGSYTDMELGTGRSSHLISIRFTSGGEIEVPVHIRGSLAIRQRNTGHAKKALSTRNKTKKKSTVAIRII